MMRENEAFDEGATTSHLLLVSPLSAGQGPRGRSLAFTQLHSSSSATI
jgi:hypothetical protein